MKIVLITYGSRGDVQPMLALALALIRADHDVVLAASPENADWAAHFGCPFKALGSSVTAFIDSMPESHSLRSAICFNRFIRKELAGQFRNLPKIISGADLVVGASLAFALATIAEFMGIDYRYIAFTPQLLPSRHHPLPAFRSQRFPGWCNLFTWQAAKCFDRFNYARLVNRKRKRLGLPPVVDLWFHILGPRVIVASDKAISPVPQDVVPLYSQTGYLHLTQPHVEHLELDAFIDAGTAPIFVGFGSMPKADQAGHLFLILEAARATGCRVVLPQFWRDISGLSAFEDLFFISDFPHLRLFPRMAAVIHHGGAGTTATATASGVPQIIVPHILDQYYWAHRVYKAGLGPKPIWRSKLTTRRLTAAIGECLADDRFRRRAQQVSETIYPQESLDVAVREILSADSNS